MLHRMMATHIFATAIASTLDSDKPLNSENIVSAMMLEASRNEIPDSELKAFSVNTVAVASGTSVSPIIANLEDIAKEDDPLMHLAGLILSEENMQKLQQELDSDPDDDEEEGSLLDLVRSLRGRVNTEKDVN